MFLLFTMGLIALLPVLTSASQEIHIDDIFEDPYTGDVLNVTKCYCEEVNYNPNDSKKPSWASYYEASYYNWHNYETYVLPQFCDSSDLSGDTTEYKCHHNKACSFEWVPKCWSAPYLGKKMCLRFGEGNVFCYKAGNVDGRLSDHDHYYFNEQERETHGLFINNDHQQIPDMCIHRCKELGGKVLANNVSHLLRLFFPKQCFV